MVTLDPWREQEFWLLERCNTPEMTAHLGGPESPEKLRDRHRRYVENAGLSANALADIQEHNARAIYPRMDARLTQTVG